MTARIHVDHSLGGAERLAASGEVLDHSPEVVIALDYSVGQATRALAYLDEVVERVRADVLAAETSTQEPAPEAVQRPCGSTSARPCHLDCATPAEWDAASRALRESRA